MGLDGSSGYHTQRRTKLELMITNAAIEAIKARHGFTSINIFGQSGGGTLVGSAIPLRYDINCAVPGSGGRVRPAKSLQHPPADPALHRMNPYGDLPNSSAPARRASRSWPILTTRPSPLPRRTRSYRVSVRRGVRSSLPATTIAQSVVRLLSRVTRECVRRSSSEQIASALANSGHKVRIAEPAPRRDPGCDCG